MKNQWLAKRNVELQWEKMGDTYKEKAETLFEAIENKRKKVNGVAVYLGSDIERVMVKYHPQYLRAPDIRNPFLNRSFEVICSNIDYKMAKNEAHIAYTENQLYYKTCKIIVHGLEEK